MSQDHAIALQSGERTILGLKKKKKLRVSKLILFLRQSFTYVAQIRVQWHNLGSLQLCIPGSNDSPASVFQAAGITGTCYHAQLILYF